MKAGLLRIWEKSMPARLGKPPGIGGMPPGGAEIFMIRIGCPKSHCAKVQAYCSACDHLICKISSGLFQKSSSFEEFNGFSEIDVHFFQ